MRKTYVVKEWKNLPDKTTPVTAENLNHIEQGIKNAMDERALKEIYGDENIDLTSHDPAKTIGDRSIQHGYAVNASGDGSYAGGSGSTASGNYSHAEGYSAKASGHYSHAEGESSEASGYASHAEGYKTKATKSNSHAEGNQTNSTGTYAHSEGTSSTASGSAAHAEGSLTTASGSNAHAEGNSTIASGNCSHAEGNGTRALGNCNHAEGYETIAGFEQQPNVSQYSHAEGNQTVAAGNYCHAEGTGTTAGETPSTSAAHAEGNGTKAIGSCSHAEGDHTIARGYAQHVCGKYNIEDSGQNAFVVGGGTSETQRKNLCMIDWGGNAVFAGNVQGTVNGKTLSLYGIQMEMEGRFNYLASAIRPAKIFDTKADLDEWLAVEGNSVTLSAGQNIYIKDKGTPDYWWDGTCLQVLETDKIVVETLTYDETMAILNGTAEVA